MILFYRHSRQWVTSASSETAPRVASSKQQEGAYKPFTLLMGDQCREDICSNSVIRGAAAVSTALGFWNPIQQTIDWPVMLLTVSFCVFCHREEALSQEPHGPFFFAARDAHAMWVWDPQFTASGLCKYCSHSRHGCEQRRKEVSAIGVTSLLPRAARGSKSVCSWWVDVL